MLARFSPVHLDRPDELQAYAELLAESSRENWGELAQTRDPEEFATEALASTGTVEFYLVHLPDEDAPVGALEIGVGDSSEPDAAFVYIMVLKALQGYGFGQAALRFAEERSRQLGQRKIVGTCSARSLRDNRNVRFLLKAGFEERLMLLRQDLVLGGRDALLHELAGPVDGVEIDARWGAQSPRDLSDMLALIPDLTASLGQTPAPRSIDAEAVLASQHQAAAAGRRLLYTLARSADTGRLLGFSEIRFGNHDAIAEQYTTFVHPDHRRRGIGSAIKARALLAMAEGAPDTSRIRTFLPAEDVAMAALNRRLGYTDTAFYREWERSL